MRQHLISCLIPAAVALMQCSCIRDEAPNAECDILSVSLPGDILSRQPVIGNHEITIMVNEGVDITNLAPTFTLTPGATISPESGTSHNFTEPVEYTVTSEDGEWHKTYTVDIQRPAGITLEYSFDHVRQITSNKGTYSYDEFYEVGTDGKISLTWASANAAFALTMQGTTPETFPTYQYTSGKKGSCVALTTRSTGTFGAAMKKPMAAGSLFIGEFAMANALAKPLEATHFGTPFMSEPLSLSGSYIYKPGEQYCVLGDDGKLKPVEGQTDEFNIYAVFFEATPEMEWLDGTNVMAADNPNIIAIAEIPEPTPSANWKDFVIPFIYREGKTVDPEKLRQGRYSITIVMCSSKKGDFFAGAIGSTLYVDELSLLCK